MSALKEPNALPVGAPDGAFSPEPCLGPAGPSLSLSLHLFTHLLVLVFTGNVTRVFL